MDEPGIIYNEEEITKEWLEAVFSKYGNIYTDIILQSSDSALFWCLLKSIWIRRNQEFEFSSTSASKDLMGRIC